MSSFGNAFKAVGNPEFYGRVWMACYKIAWDVLNESPVTANHPTRANLAERVIRDPGKQAQPFVYRAVMNPSIMPTIDAEGLASCPDSDIEFVVSEFWDVVAAGGRGAGNG